MGATPSRTPVWMHPALARLPLLTARRDAPYPPSLPTKPPQACTQPTHEQRALSPNATPSPALRKAPTVSLFLQHNRLSCGQNPGLHFNTTTGPAMPTTAEGPTPRAPSAPGPGRQAPPPSYQPPGPRLQPTALKGSAHHSPWRHRGERHPLPPMVPPPHLPGRAGKLVPSRAARDTPCRTSLRPATCAMPHYVKELMLYSVVLPGNCQAKPDGRGYRPACRKGLPAGTASQSIQADDLHCSA